MLNVPVTDTLAVRGVVYLDDQGGYIDNVFGENAYLPEHVGFPEGADSTVVNNLPFVEDDFNDAHRNCRQRACKILGKIRNLADLHACRRLQFKARDHGAGIHGNNLHFHAEIRELHFDEARHRFQCFLRITLHFLRRVIEQRQRRQLAADCRLEHLHLAFVAHLGKDWAEFIVSKPTPLEGHDVLVHHEVGHFFS